jgi:hypothetical protein
MFQRRELRPMLDEKSSQVVIWECNDNPWQLWYFINEGQFVLANNTGAFPVAPLFLLTITEIRYIY